MGRKMAESSVAQSEEAMAASWVARWVAPTAGALAASLQWRQVFP